MKNSLFKRVFAAAATVPLALTQALGVVSAEDTTVTLDGSQSALLYIEPGMPETAQSDGYTQDKEAKIFEKDSNWNTRLSAILADVAAGDKRTGTLDLSKFYQSAINKSGQYSQVTASLIEKIGEVKYAVTDDGDIIITASVDNVTPTFTAGGSNTIGGALKEIAAEYGVEDLDTPDDFFEDLVIAGDLKVVIKSSALAEGTSVAGEISFTDKATGKVYNGVTVVDWALEKLEELKKTAKDACAEYAAQGVNVAEAEKQINDSVSFYVNKLSTAKDYIAKSETVNREVKDYGNVSALISAVNKRLDKAINRKLPGSTATEIMANSTVADLYVNVLDQLNTMSGATSFDISAAEIGTFADSLYDVKAGVSGQVATFEAKFTDAEAAEAEAYLEAAYAGVDVTDVYKQVNIEIDYSAASASGATVQVDIKRVAVYDEVEIVTTTTSTTATSTTATSTTAVDPAQTTTTTTVLDPAQTSTSTTAVDPGQQTSTSTTAVVDPGQTSTSTTVVVDPGQTSTSTTVVVDPGQTSTSTTAVVDPVQTSTSTTATADPSVPVTVTTEMTVVNFDLDTKVAFYYSIDEEFDMDQVNSIRYSVDRSIITMDEDGNVLDQEVIQHGRNISISKSRLGFAQTPGEVFDQMEQSGVKQFSHRISIVAKEDITAVDGTLIAKAGDAIKTVAGEELFVISYVGVKGDADLNLKADSSDAATVLVWYAKVSTTLDKDKLSEIKFSNSPLVNLEENATLDEFAAFLADVNNDDYDGNGDGVVDNKTTLKPERKIDASDASYIQVYYSLVSTGNPDNWDTWNKKVLKKVVAE